MAVFGVSITKEIDWRGSQEQFSNVYHYSTDPAETFDDLGVIAEIERLEKLIFSDDVVFVTGRTWGPTDEGPLASVTREIVDLSGVGNAPRTSSMYKECAILITWPLGRYGTRNRPQFLRKWLHTDNPHGYVLNGAQPLAGQPTAGTPLREYMDGITRLDNPGLGWQYELCTASGREFQGEPVAYPYLEHRQFNQ